MDLKYQLHHGINTYLLLIFQKLLWKLLCGQPHLTLQEPDKISLIKSIIRDLNCFHVCRQVFKHMVGESGFRLNSFEKG